MDELKRAGTVTRFRKKALICSICLDFVSVRGRLEVCEHWFCFECILQWASKENTCPLCKERFYRVRKEALRRTYGKTGSKEVCVTDRSQDKPVFVFPPCP